MPEDNKEKFYYHTSTTNTSFINMYKYLKEKGIENNKFFLKIYDYELTKIDPLNEKKLSLEMKARVLKEIARNPFYFLREIIRIPETGGFSRFKLNPGNLAALFCLMNNLNVIEILPRQQGKTISNLCYIYWIYEFGTTNTTILFGNKTPEDAQLNIERVVNIRELLPEYIKRTDNEDVNNIKKIARKGEKSNKNSIKALSTPNSAESAAKLGRGLTSPILYWDEVAFVNKFSIIYSSATLALSKAKERAIENNKPYFKLFTTTPNFLDDSSGKFIKGMIENSAQWDETLYDFSYEQLQDYIYNNSRNNFMYIEYTWKALGLSEKWYEEQCRDLNWDVKEIKKEVDLVWQYASSNSPFSETDLESIEENAQEPISSYILDKKWKFDIFVEEIDVNYPYAVSIDVAGGLSRDNTCISIIDPKTDMTVAEFISNTLTIPKLEEIILLIGTKWLNKAFFIIERNNYGLGVIQHIIEDSKFIKIRDRLFYAYKEFEVATRRGMKTRENLVSNAKKNKKMTKVYGINTTGESREVMFDILSETVAENPFVLNTKSISADIRNLEINKKGKIEHREGEHDDKLFSWLIYMRAKQEPTFFRKFYRPPAFTEKQAEKLQTFRRLLYNPMKYEEGLSEISKQALKMLENEEKKKNNTLIDFFIQMDKEKREAQLDINQIFNKN